MATQRTNVPDGSFQVKQIPSGEILTQQLLIGKLGAFIERTFKNNPLMNLYLKEWEGFKTLLNSKQLDYDKIYTYLSKVLALTDNQNHGPLLSARGDLALNSKLTRTNENALEPNLKSLLNHKSPSRRASTYSIDQRNSSDLPQVNRAAFLERFHKLKAGMKLHTESLIKIAHKRQLTQSSFSKSGDRTPLRRVAVYTKDNQKTDIFKEIEENLNFIKESNYNNYRILN